MVAVVQAVVVAAQAVVALAPVRVRVQAAQVRAQVLESAEQAPVWVVRAAERQVRPASVVAVTLRPQQPGRAIRAARARPIPAPP